jgi:sulfur carrier protein
MQLRFTSENQRPDAALHSICNRYDARLSSKAMTVHLSHPERNVEIKGPKRVKELLRDLNLVVEAHLVIRGDDLVTEDEILKDSDQVEIRPVISGG